MRDRRNVVVAILAFVTGLLVFVGNLWLARTLQPPMLRVLAAARTLRAGDVLTEDAVRVVEVYQDARASLYISEAEKDAFLGGYVARDYAAGEPLLRTAVWRQGVWRNAWPASWPRSPIMCSSPFPWTQTMLWQEIPRITDRET